MDVTRRQLVAMGTVGAAGTILGKMAISGSPAVAGERLPGLHISVLTKAVSPDPPAKGFPHHFAMTVYGPDNALNGMGWGGAFDLQTQEDMANSQMFQCVYSVTGPVQGDVARLHGLMLFAGLPHCQGQLIEFEADLAAGLLRVHIPHLALTFEGTGVVARI